MYKQGFQEADETEIKRPASVDYGERREFQKNIYSCFTDYTKAFNSVDHNELWKIITEMGIPDHLTCLLTNIYADQETTVKTDIEQLIGSKVGKDHKAVHCHPAYLTYMQSTSCETLGWMNLKLELRLLGEISTTSDMQMIPL